MTGPLIPESFTRGRLSYERVTAAHGPAYAALLTHPMVIPWLWPFENPPTPEDAENAVRRAGEHWDRHGFGLWMLRDPGTGAVIGRGGVAWVTDLPQGPEVEVGWLIDPDRWNQGLASELARASAETAFETLGLETLVSVTLPQNRASRRVMEKNGFRYEGETVHAGLDHVLYRLDADQFTQRATSDGS